MCALHICTFSAYGRVQAEMARCRRRKEVDHVSLMFVNDAM